jgi:hypothetical protein
MSALGAARAAGRLLVAGVAVLALAACGSRGEEPRVLRNGPSFHSAGPEAREEINEVLEWQARLIAEGDWEQYFQLFVPTERARCSPEIFALFAEQVYGPLRQRAEGSTLSANLVDLKVNGFRASVEYQLVLREYGLATQASTDSYLKLGDRWFIDEQAC